MEKSDERMRDRRIISAGKQLMRQRVEGQRILAKVGEIENCFRVRQLQMG